MPAQGGHLIKELVDILVKDIQPFTLNKIENLDSCAVCFLLPCSHAATVIFLTLMKLANTAWLCLRPCSDLLDLIGRIITQRREAKRVELSHRHAVDETCFMQSLSRLMYVLQYPARCTQSPVWCSFQSSRRASCHQRPCRHRIAFEGRPSRSS